MRKNWGYCNLKASRISLKEKPLNLMILMKASKKKYLGPK
jgi:hypothetical protein